MIQLSETDDEFKWTYLFKLHGCQTRFSPPAGDATSLKRVWCCVFVGVGLSVCLSVCLLIHFFGDDVG